MKNEKAVRQQIQAWRKHTADGLDGITEDIETSPDGPVKIEKRLIQARLDGALATLDNVLKLWDVQR